MKTLIDKVLSLENEAERILDDARREAKKIDADADAQIAQLRADGEAVLQRRIQEYRNAAEQKHQDEVAKARAALAQELERVKQVPDSVVEQAAKIVARFCFSHGNDSMMKMAILCPVSDGQRLRTLHGLGLVEITDVQERN